MFHASLIRIFKTASQRKDNASSLVRHLMHAMDNLWTFLKKEEGGMDWAD
ncbi:MAG: hypothetical protein LBS77_06525 [Desulfovibrio sp.]|jgi:hypothetical protein|nr:hypothetical protein [Desulfovibrio sp.]